MISKILRKYSNMADEMKAAMWYTISNIVQRIAPWLVIIILTRFLSTEQYGVYTVFMSWLEIVEIIVTMKIHASGYVAGLVQNDTNRNVYSSTMQILSFILISAWIVIYLVFHEPLNKFTGIDFSLFLLMLISLHGTVSIGLWSSQQRVNNKYKSVFAATLIYGVLGPVAGALTVFGKFENPIFVVILVRTIIQLVATSFFALGNLKGSFTKWDKKFAGAAISYNLPLIPYYLSMVLLNHSDRLMIQKICGYEEAGIYSVAYSVSMIILVVSNALNLSLQVWLFKSIKAEKQGDQTRLITIGTIVVAILALIELTLAPEAIFLLGGKVYMEAMWVMPPIVMSVLVMFIYQQYANLLFYFKRTRLIMLISVIAAGTNIGLNAWLIPVYGYLAAGYTTLISYLLILILYIILMRNTCKKNNINPKTYYNVWMQMGVLGGTMLFAMVIMFFYEQAIIRYIIAAILLVITFLNRKRIKEMFKAKKA